MRAAVERVLHDVWSHRGIAASLLYPFSLVYLAIARRRAARTTPVELPAPVVVVGNIYVGGTGKTPITIELVRELKAAGFTPGVISRGYRARQQRATPCRRRLSGKHRRRRTAFDSPRHRGSCSRGTRPRGRRASADPEQSER